jgi:hypothetical protein
MSVINQMLRDLDKQQAAGSVSAAAGSVAAGSVTAGSVVSAANGAAGSSQNLLRPLLFLLLAGFIGWLIWPAVQARLQEPVPVTVLVPQPVFVSPPEVTTATAAVEPEVVVTAQPEPEPITASKETAEPVTLDPITAAPITETPITETPIIETPIIETSVIETPIIETPAPASDSQVFAATPEADLSAQLSVQSAAIKQPSSMQVEKVKQDPKLVAAEQARVQQQQQVQQLLQLARQASQQQQWQQTLQLLQQIPPDLASADIWQLQANARQQLGDFPGALASWQQLLTVQPQLAQAWLGKALAHDQLAQLPEARAAYQQAYALPGLSAASRQFIQQRLAQ